MKAKVLVICLAVILVAGCAIAQDGQPENKVPFSWCIKGDLMTTQVVITNLSDQRNLFRMNFGEGLSDEFTLEADESKTVDFNRDGIRFPCDGGWIRAKDLFEVRTVMTSSGVGRMITTTTYYRSDWIADPIMTPFGPYYPQSH